MYLNNSIGLAAKREPITTGWGILLMGGEPIKLTELRELRMERNWQGVLALGGTQDQWGACARFGFLAGPAGV